MELIKIIRTRHVRPPKRFYDYDAGLNFFIPDDFSEVLLFPNKNIIIPSGIIVIIEEGYMGLFLNRSSIASKKNLLVGAQVIDSHYKGEVHFDLHNVGIEPITLTPSLQITQLIILPISLPKVIEVDLIDSDFLKPTLRDTKGFGSTNK